MTKKISCLLIILFHFVIGICQDSVTVKEYLKTFPTYPFSDPSPIPLLTEVYPYFRFDGFTDKAENKQWKVVEIENAYIKILILPQIGGKIWAAIDKQTNKPFLYYNLTVKFRDIAMRGPWTSGGLESNFGIIGHTPNCATPVDYMVQKKEDGSISCIIGALDLLTRSNWRVDINVPKDKAYFTTQAFWYNTTPAEQPYYHWMNAAVKATDDLEYIYPGNRYIGHNGEYAAWPVNEKNGKKISFYKNNNFGSYKSYHVFGSYTNFFGVYYHSEDAGMARYSTHDDKAGKKIWIWGLSDQGKIWEKLLTDSDGQYSEIQSGRLFNQNTEQSSFTPFKHIPLSPYQTDSWTEYWYPVEKTKGFVEANEYGAFNLQYENGWLNIHYFPVAAINDSLVIKDGKKIIYKTNLHLSPEQVFADSVQVNADAGKLKATIGVDKLNYNADTTAGILKRPVESPDKTNWSNAYGLYVQGQQLMDQKMYAAAEEKLTASLQQDSNFLPTLVQLSQLMYRSLRYAEALNYAAKAISINSVAGNANYYYGLINEQLGDTINAKDGFDIAALDPAYRSAAYTELAAIYNNENNKINALDYINKALAYNAANITALQLQAVIYRHQQDKERAEKTLQVILRFDPLNHAAFFERYQWNKTENNSQLFTQTITNELPQETYTELAIWYYKNGCEEEARQLFTLALPSPEAAYWLAFLNKKKINFDTLSPAFSLPFRSETAGILQQLITSDTNWLLKYQLALIYHDRNRLEDCKQLLASCGNEPQFAPFYAVRAAIAGDNDSNMAKADLQKALLLDNGWRYYKLLAEYYLLHNQNDLALSLVEPYAKAHPHAYIMGLLYTKILMLNRQLRKADDIISHLNVLPFEGATESHDLYREVKLKEAIAELNNKHYKSSLAFIKAASAWPTALGVGKPYEEDIDYRLEDWIAYQCYVNMHNKKAAAEALQKIIHFSNSTGGERNVYAANALITLWTYDELNQTSQGDNWLQKQKEYSPDNKWLLWAQAMYEHNVTSTASGLNSNARILYELVKK